MFTGTGNRTNFALKWAPDVKIGNSTVKINNVAILRDSYTLTITKSTAKGYTSYAGIISFDIAPMTGALAKVAQLKPVTYKWNVDGSDSQGFIAHELQQIIPDCVTGVKDAIESIDELDAEGRSIGTKEVPVYQGVDTSFLVATLVAAIQEQQVLITQLQADVATLKGN